MHADLVVDDELQPREADAGVRQLRELEGELRVADVHGDLHRDARHLAALAARDLEGDQALVDVAGIALGARHRDLLSVLQRCASRRRSRPPPGMPSSRAMIAAWQVRPPRLVTMAAASFITGSQFGSVMSVTRMSPSFTRDIFEASATTRTVPLPILLPIARPVTSTRELPFSAIALLDVALARLHRLRPRLQDVELAVGAVLAPLDVHRPAVVLLDRDRVARELEHVCIGQRETMPLGLGHVDVAGRLAGWLADCENTIFCSFEPSARRTIAGLAPLEHRLVDVELVGVDRALHHHFAQAVGRGDEDDVAEARIRYPA